MADNLGLVILSSTFQVQYSGDRKKFFLHVPVGYTGNVGSLDLSKLKIVSSGFDGLILAVPEGSLVQPGSSFSLRFEADFLTAFTGYQSVTLTLLPNGPASTIGFSFPGYVYPFYSSTWDAGPNPVLRVGDCSCVTIEVVGCKPGGVYTLQNIHESKGLISSMDFKANENGVYYTRSSAEIPSDFVPGKYTVKLLGPGIPGSGWKVDSFTIEGEDPVLPGDKPAKCPPDKPRCPEGYHPEPKYATVMPAECPIVGWECLKNEVNGGDGGQPGVKPSCSIVWDGESGKFATRKQGQVAGIKLTVINLGAGITYRIQNYHVDTKSVISEVSVVSDADGVLVFEDHETVILGDLPLGDYRVRVAGPGVLLTCGGFKLMAGNDVPVCQPGMELGPGDVCIPIQSDRRLWVLIAAVAAVFLLSRRGK